MKCPICNKRVPKSHFACESGSRGGKAGTGKNKARTSEQARNAVMAMHAKRREAQLAADLKTVSFVKRKDGTKVPKAALK